MLQSTIASASLKQKSCTNTDHSCTNFHIFLCDSFRKDYQIKGAFHSSACENRKKSRNLLGISMGNTLMFIKMISCLVSLSQTGKIIYDNSQLMLGFYFCSANVRKRHFEEGINIYSSTEKCFIFENLYRSRYRDISKEKYDITF